VEWLFPKWKQPLFSLTLRFQKYFLDALISQESLSQKVRLSYHTLHKNFNVFFHFMNDPFPNFFSHQNARPVAKAFLWDGVNKTDGKQKF
jgi:hypothetical protein